MPHLPLRNLLDRKDMNLPEATGKSFWLHGSAWQFPDFENGDTLKHFVGQTPAQIIRTSEFEEEL